MADRIIEMRSLLRKNLEELGSKHDWSHITSQVTDSLHWQTNKC
jgi:aspartate aminotransferase